MAGDWRINPDERVRYESYFQQCGPVQGYLSGEQARDFFVKSTLPGDVLRKIWDLADITADGRLDKREFAIACCLISSQVQKKGPLPATLPSNLLSDAGVTLNGIAPAVLTAAGQSSMAEPPASHLVKPTNPVHASAVPLTPIIRSKYLEQFHSLVDVSKTNGFMSGLQAKHILQQTGLSHILLHQIWNLADIDKDGRLTPEEFIVAMYCCDIARTGQALPITVPDEWLPTNPNQRVRINSTSKSNEPSTYAHLNQQLKETMNQTHTIETSSAETAEAERKAAAVTYEDKRAKNYEDGNRELERRRQLLREQEEREHKEREERERKRDLEIQKQKDEQERKKQMEIERQLEKQRQIEQQKEEERKKLYEQREAARKEMERKSRLDWERQRMQELSSQKSRLNDQINDLKSRGKASELELENIDDTIQTCQTKITQTETNIHAMDESIAEIQRNISAEKNQFESMEQEKKDLSARLNETQAERGSLNSSLNQLNQSKEFNNGSRDLDQIKNLQSQMETMTEESTQINAEMTTANDQCKEYQDQLERLRLQLDQLEQEAKDKKPASQITTPTNPPAEFANFDQFNATPSSDDLNHPSAETSSSLPVAPTAATSSSPTIDVDPFQRVDPFASQSDIGTTTGASNEWCQPSTNESPLTTVDPFLPQTETTETLPVAASSRTKKAAPKVNPNLKGEQKEAPTVDPWGGTTNGNDGENNWAQFDQNNSSSSFGTTAEWPQTTVTTDVIQYRVLYDYTGERPDELSISSGEIVIIDPTKQHDEHWLFGQIGNDRQGLFPVAYAERITSTPASNTVDTTSQLPSGSWVMALADCQGKTVDKHLSFHKGELISVREEKDATWYSGYLHGKIGWFPRNYVRPATATEIEDNKNSTNDTTVSEKALNSSNDDHQEIYEAIYSYEAMDTSDLSFDIGERITVLKRDGDWWTGRIGDRTGIFPNNYVQKIENIPEIAVATTAYQSNEEGHLSFEQDQIIYITKKDENELYQGEIRLPDQPVYAGWFPANYVQIQTVNPPLISSQPNPSELTQYMAIFPYEAQQEDELSFPADAVLEILDPINASGWFKARLGEQVGLIPSTYVQPIDAYHQQQ